MSYLRINSILLTVLLFFGCNPEAETPVVDTDEALSAAGGVAAVGVGTRSVESQVKTVALPLADLTLSEPTPDDNVHIIELAADDERSTFNAFGPGHNVAFSSAGMTLSYVYADKPKGPTAGLDDHLLDETVSVEFHGTDPQIQGEGLEPYTTSINTWRDGAFVAGREGFAGIRFPNAYPGIDLYYIDSGSNFSFVFVVHPGGDANVIRFSVNGGNETYIDTNGTLITKKYNGTFEISKPISFQSTEIGEAFVDSEFEVTAGEAEGFNLVERETVGIALGAYPATAPLIIDPTITFATLLGNSQNTRISVDSNSGDIYVAGASASHAAGVFYVGRHDGSNGALLAQTLIFAGARDILRDIYVAGDDVYVTGDTRADFLNGFVSDPPPLQPTFNGGSDAFVMRLDRLSLAPEYGTYFGGSTRESGVAIRADSAGNVYLAGYSDSSDLPLTGGSVDPSHFDSFVIKFLPAAGSTSDLLYAKMMGGAILDSVTDADLDDAGNLYIVGRTNSPDFPLVNPMPVPFAPATVGYNPFLAKFDATGEIVFSSYAHKNDVESGIFALGMDVSASGDAIGFGGTVFDVNLQTRGYIMKVGRAPGSEAYTMAYTHKPEGNGTVVHAVALDGANNIYGVGESGPDFVVTEPTDGLDGVSAFLYVLSDTAGTETLLFSKAFGGTGTDRATDICVDPSTNVVVIAGSTTSDPFTGLNDSDLESGSERGFLLKFDAVIAPPPPPNETPVATLSPIDSVEFRDVSFRVTPETLNKKSNGQWVKGHLTLLAAGNVAVTLDATASSDPDGDDLTYKMDLDHDGTITTYQEEQVTTELGLGNYIVTLTVCDPSEACASAQTTFAITQIDLAALTAADFTLNGVVAQEVNFEEDDVVINFPRGEVADTVEVGDSVAMVLDGAISAIDHIKVISPGNGHGGNGHDGDDDGDDDEDEDDDDEEDDDWNLWDFLRGLIKKVWNVLLQIWEYIRN